MLQDLAPQGNQGPTRPLRFAIQLPMRYRHAGSFQWYRGVTDDISCSGMLFRGPVPMELFAPVEVRLMMPRQITGDAAATMLCGGFIARVLDTRPSIDEAHMAATFTTYRLLSTNGQRRDEVSPLESVTATTRDDLVGQFVHEFRNMLEVVIGHADLLLMREDLDASVRTSAMRIREAGERAATLTKALGG